MKTNFKLKTLVVAFVLGITLLANAQDNPPKGSDGPAKISTGDIDKWNGTDKAKPKKPKPIPMLSTNSSSDAHENTGNEVLDGSAKSTNGDSDKMRAVVKTKGNVKNNLSGEATENAVERKGWDGTVKGGSKKQEISCPDGSTMTNGRCVPNELLRAKWLDLETGEIKYFEYTQDTPIDNPAICKALGVEACVILKGRYMVDRSDDSGGKMTLRITPIKWINRPPIPESRAFAFEGTNPKGQNCSGFGNSCFYAIPSSEDAKAGMRLPYFITPIVTEELCKSIVVQWKGINPKCPGF